VLEQPAATGLLPLCEEYGVGVIAVSVFNSGILAHPEPPDDATYEYGQAPAALLEKARSLAGIAREHRVELPDLAVQFPLRHPAVESVVLGMRTAEQVHQNAARMRTPVPEEAWDAAAAV
jgi:D-threo-aldose 1-dehydrogenase